jgi:hypothetical protein
MSRKEKTASKKSEKIASKYQTNGDEEPGEFFHPIFDHQNDIYLKGYP